MKGNATRPDGRSAGELRPVTMELGFARSAEGSVLYRSGRTTVLCNASVEESVPEFLRGKGRGWVTAEYSMLPRATDRRESREGRKGGGASGRTQEIQRLVGRALRGVVRLDRLGERSIVLDCDVIEADAGTRVASVTGAFVALSLALEGLRRKGEITRPPLRDTVAAVSVVLAGTEPRLDPSYVEDRDADVDMNIVMTGRGELVEVQGTAEGTPFGRNALGALLDLAESGIRTLSMRQREMLQQGGVDLPALLEADPTG